MTTIKTTTTKPISDFDGKNLSGTVEVGGVEHRINLGWLGDGYRVYRNDGEHSHPWKGISSDTQVTVTEERPMLREDVEFGEALVWGHALLILPLALGGHQVGQDVHDTAFNGVVFNAALARAAQMTALKDKACATKEITVQYYAVKAAHVLCGVFSEKADMVEEYVKFHVVNPYLIAA